MNIPEIYVNRSAYKANELDTIVELKVRVKLDPVIGWGDNIMDHINLMFRDDLYIQSAQPMPSLQEQVDALEVIEHPQFSDRTSIGSLICSLLALVPDDMAKAIIDDCTNPSDPLLLIEEVTNPDGSASIRV